MSQLRRVVRLPDAVQVGLAVRRPEHRVAGCLTKNRRLIQPQRGESDADSQARKRRAASTCKMTFSTGPRHSNHAALRREIRAFRGAVLYLEGVARFVANGESVRSYRFATLFKRMPGPPDVRMLQ